MTGDAGTGGVPAGFRRETRTVDGAGTTALVGGDGPPLVLLHGWPQTSRAWRRVAPALAAAGYTVVAPDLPGLGGSDPLPAGYGKDAVAGALRTLVHDLVGAGPVRVVGHDIGGMVAFAWARTHPDEVARLVVVDTGLPGLGLERAMDVARGGRWHHGFFMTPDVPAMLVAGTEDEFFTWWFGRLAGDRDAFPPAEVAATTAAYRGRAALDRGFGHYRALLDDGRATAAWLDGGGRLPMPVAAVGGGLSLGERVAQDLAPAAPDLRAIVVDGAGHFVAEEQPDSFVEQLVPFLADRAAGATRP
ncbi:alpha/beta fold hydrolase [Pseudonocardia broussonetiae]|uniref:alpha/beta fold hydrolase n=1 Tax=Pseudonocardia broussonetiae TaxID=2736640 RepID=UPI001962FDF0|nr:alpha/beta hydrolase [Pseudonocardia broussonetiae]